MDIRDSDADLPVQSSSELLSTPIFDVVEETFPFGERGQTLRRSFVKHLSAVAVLAVDQQDRVLLINQYRHPVRMKLWEIPAGLLDVAGEPMLEAAQRELAEEADLQAQTWHVLSDFYATPGAHDEAIRIYLAEGLSEVPEAQRHTREAEEARSPRPGFRWPRLSRLCSPGRSITRARPTGSWPCMQSAAAPESCASPGALAGSPARQGDPAVVSPSEGVGIQRLRKSQHLSNLGDLHGDDVPDEPMINTSIVVDDEIPHRDDVAPGDLGVLVTHLRGNPFARLSDDLDGPLSGTTSQDPCSSEAMNAAKPCSAMPRQI